MANIKSGAMQTFLPAFLLAAVVLSSIGAFGRGGLVLAQTAPSAGDMVEQLKSQSGPRTRSLRNLTVEAVPNAAASVAGNYDAELVLKQDDKGDTLVEKLVFVQRSK